MRVSRYLSYMDVYDPTAEFFEVLDKHEFGANLLKLRDGVKLSSEERAMLSIEVVRQGRELSMCAPSGIAVLSLPLIDVVPALSEITMFPVNVSSDRAHGPLYVANLPLIPACLDKLCLATDDLPVWDHRLGRSADLLDERALGGVVAAVVKLSDGAPRYFAHDDSVRMVVVREDVARAVLDLGMAFPLLGICAAP